MITRKQIEKHCGDRPFSDLLWVSLDRDYKIKFLDYILPAGTIAQVIVYIDEEATLYIHSKCVTVHFPYDAATLLEDEE